MTELLHSGLLQRALAEIVVVGAACGPLGVWLLHRRFAYAAESISHAMLPGLVLAALIGVPLVIGAGAGVLLAAALIALAARDVRVGSDVAVGIAVSACFGLGAVLALAPDVPARLDTLLFGDLLGATTTDLLVAGGLAVAVGAALALGHRALAAATFDPTAARSLGVSTGRSELGLLMLLGVAVVAAVQGLGSLLVFALLVAPAATALRLGASLKVQLLSASALGAAAGVLGMLASAELDLAAGACVGSRPWGSTSSSRCSPRAPAAPPPSGARRSRR